MFRHFLLLMLILVVVNAEDPGEPLFLTPYIEANLIEEAQNLAWVDKSQFKGVSSYSGYLTVDRNTDSHLFFWHFPAEKNAAKAPVVLWQQSNPSTSTMVGIFTGNGPFYLDNRKLKLSKYSWIQNHNMIYIESPVGTGYSRTRKPFVDNNWLVAKHFYKALIQFFKLFPHLRENKFFIAGEGYAGKFAPALALAIHERNLSSKSKLEMINLGGIAIGNGLIVPEQQLSYGAYLYQLGILDKAGKRIFDESNTRMVNYIQEENYEAAYDEGNRLLYGHYNGTTIFTDLTGFTNFHNYLIADQHNEQKDNLARYIQQDEVRKLIHVGNTAFQITSDEVFEKFVPVIMRSAASKLTVVLNHYPVMIYNGQLDVICPYPQMVNMLNHLKFKDAGKYKAAVRDLWRVDGELAGYVKHGGNLVEVFVRNAGHSVVTDQPKWALNMITHFTQGIHYPEEEQ